MILLNARSRVSVEQTFLNLIGISAPPPQNIQQVAYLVVKYGKHSFWDQ